MPFDGAGTFSRNYDFETDRTNAIPIMAARVDGEFDNYAAAFNQTFLRSGIVPMAANLRMGSFSITGLGDGTVSSPALAFSNDVSSGLYRVGAQQIGVSIAGTKRLQVDATGASVVGNFSASGTVSDSGGQLARLASPVFTGTPSAPTPISSDNNTTLATTAYVKAQSYITASALTPYAPLASPALTGTPTAPTQATADNTTAIATTAFVKAQAYAPLASPALTGTPTAPTVASSDNSTTLATTAFVKNQSYITASALSSYAPLASPALTGVPTAPTQVSSDNSTALATTAFVKAQSYATTSSLSSYAPLASPALTGTPTSNMNVAGSTGTAYEIGTRSIPTTTATAARALGANDNQTCNSNTTGGWTIPDGLAVGTIFQVYNDSAATQTVSMTGTDTLRLNGTTTTGTRTVPVRGLCSIQKVKSTEWVFSGGS